MSSGNKRRFFDRNASPVVATDDDFDAVFGSVTTSSASIAQDIPIERIRANPFQARTKFKDVEALAASMRMHGFTSRLRVRRDPAQPQFFQLVYGERRLRAAQVAGIKVVPCDVAEYSDQQMREIGLTENLQRSDLEPLEEARAFRVAIDGGGYSIRTLAAQLGKSKGYVQGRLDLLRTPDDVQNMVNEHPETFTAGLLIGQLATAEQRQPLIESVLNGDLDKESVRDIVRSIAATTAVPRRSPTAQLDGVDMKVVDGAGAPPPQHDMQGETPVPPAAQHQLRRRAAAAEQHRMTRQSERALGRATQTLQAMTHHLEQGLPELQATERGVLLDFIVQHHLPKVEEIIAQLRDLQK
jgi:ParB family transcriptional regulator, chromosome partitioning protein